MSAYTDFLADPQAIPLWIAELYPLDVDTETEQTLRVATDEYATEPSDTPANTPYTDAVLIEGPNYETDAVPAGTLGQLPPGRGGELRLGIRMGDIDTWRAYAWSGRRAVVRHGGYSPRLGGRLAYADMGVAEYEIERAKFGLDIATLQLRDPARKFDDPLQTRRYMGTDFTLRFGSTGVCDFGNLAKCNITGDLTIETRLWMDTFATTGNIALWTVAPYPFQFYITTFGKLAFGASNYAAHLVCSGALATKRWYHVRVTRSGTAITFRWVEEATGTETTETFTASAASGAADTGGGVLRLSGAANSLQGIVDEYRIWSAVRTEDEWRDARSRELTSTEAAASNLKMYCRCNDATGTTLTDSSSSPGNGTLSGTVSWLPSLQGKTDLVGKVLPDGFGYVEDANPVLVYEPTRVYQIHSRNSNGSFTVYEGGASITAGTAYTDWLAFLLATTTAAQADTLSCTDGTFLRLGSNPSKPISVTFQGDATGSGYVSTAADITRRIITTRGKSPLADPGDLDTTYYSNLNTANSAVVGLYFSAETTIAEAIKRSLGSVGAVGWYQRTTGKHRVKRFVGAAGGSSVVTLTEKEIISIEPLDPEQPVWEEILSYRPNYSPMTLEQMAAGAITTARQAFLEKAFREVPRTAARTKRVHQFARTERLQTYLTTEAAAVAEADRRLALFAEEAQAYRLEVNAVGLQLDRMDVVTLDLKDLDAAGAEQTRLGLAAVDFVVLAIGERSAEGKALLTMWREDFAGAAVFA